MLAPIAAQYVSLDGFVYLISSVRQICDELFVTA